MAGIVCQGVRSNQDDCRRSNSTCAYNYYFDKGTGRCVECALGNFGWNCKKDCTSGYYGYLCQKECECEADHCDPVTGCTKSVHEYTTEGMSLEDSTTQVITQEVIEPVAKFHTTPCVCSDDHCFQGTGIQQTVTLSVEKYAFGQRSRIRSFLFND